MTVQALRWPNSAHSEQMIVAALAAMSAADANASGIVMPYRLTSGESLDEGLARIAEEQALKAAELLKADGASAYALRKARARFKKVRAVLRLGRHALGEAYAKENIRFRDAGRLIAVARDADAAVTAAEGLFAVAASVAEEEAASALLAHLVRKRRKIRADETSTTRDVERAARMARAGAKAVAKLDWPSRFAEVSPAIAKSYARARRTMLAALDSGDIEMFHEWRKDAKHHFRHEQIFAGLWPGVLDSRVSELSRLGRILGSLADYQLLEESAAAWSPTKTHRDNRRRVMSLIDDKMIAAMAAARDLGDHLFKDKPSHMRAAHEALWAARR